MSHRADHLVGQPPPPVGGVLTPGSTMPQFATNSMTDAPPSLLPSQQGRFPDGDPLGFEVYVGTTKSPTAPDTPRGFGDSTAYTKTKHKKTVFSLMRELEKADKEEQREMALALVLGGYGNQWSTLQDAREQAAEMSLGDLLTNYTELLDEAAGKLAMGIPVTPEQVLAKNIAYRLPGKVEWDGDLSSLPSATAPTKGAGGEEEGEDPFTGTKTQTSTDISRDIMDPNDAMALTRGMLQRELGRDPTKAEFEDFIGTLQGAQMANPSRTKSTLSTTFEEGELVDTSRTSTTHSGIGAEGLADIALRKARSNPGWAEWQAVGTYGPALISALGSVVPGR